MRAKLLTAAALILSLPVAAAAQDTAEPEIDSSASELQQRLMDPAEQERLATMLGAMSEVLLDIPVGPLLEAMEQTAGVDAPPVDEGATLRDMAGDRAGEIPAEITEKLPVMMGMLGEVSGALSAMRPQLEAMAAQMRERIEQAETD